VRRSPSRLNRQIVQRAGLCGLFLLLAASSLPAQALSPAWVELGDGGQAIVRIVVSAPECPSLQVDGVSRPMMVRQPLPAGLRPLCQAPIPANAKSASLNGQTLALPRANPSRVVVMGDTGCRIKGARVQDCNDMTKWPFHQVAGDASREHPDLVIHVGDYLYREDKCPPGSEAKCGDTPAGDNWDAWNADFFTPAAELLKAAPWAFSRGNHEDCGRSWRGWFYYLDPRDWDGTCQEYSKPYVVQLGAFRIGMLDSAAVKEDQADERQIAIYGEELASLHLENGWLVDHHPIWGFKTDQPGSMPLPLSVPLEEAWKRVSPVGIRLILSGHIHVFEFVALDGDYPRQVVAGDGGTEMALPFTSSVHGIGVRGASVQSGESLDQFGYTLLTRDGNGWQLSLMNHLHKTLMTCSVFKQPANCHREGSR
jgi:hypothetical protein